MPLSIPAPGTICPALATEPFATTLYGYPGVGKSPMLACLPDHFYIDLQMGSKYFACRRVPVSNYAEFLEALEYFRAHPARFLIIDPITTLIDWAEEAATDWFHSVPIGSSEKMQAIRSVLELKGRDENAGSPGWMYLRTHYMKLVKNAWPGPKTRTIFVGHVRDAMMAAPGDKGAKASTEVDDRDVDLPGKLRNIFLSECDLAGYVFRSATNVLKVSFAAKKNAAFVKCRCPQLMGRTLDFHTPTTVDDWRQVYPETLDELCGPAAATPAPAQPLNRPNVPVSAKP